MIYVNVFLPKNNLKFWGLFDNQIESTTDRFEESGEDEFLTSDSEDDFIVEEFEKNNLMKAIEAENIIRERIGITKYAHLRCIFSRFFSRVFFLSFFFPSFYEFYY